MKLTIKQARILLTKNIPRLIGFIFESGYECAIDEVKRTHLQAWANSLPAGTTILASCPTIYGHINYSYTVGGSGISTSLHLNAMAIDIILYKDGGYITDSEFHRPFGVFWESLHPNFRWGGDKDGNHYECLLVKRLKEDKK